MKRKWTLARIQQNIPLFERLISSPLTGEERGEGDQGFQRPLTLTLSREGRGHSVQTGNMIYRTNRAHGLQWIGKEEIADAVEGNQCHGTTNSIDS
jgi:hypothetical protein